MRIFKLAALLALLAASPAMAEVYDWSQTPANNNTSDTGSDVQWSEGMAPSDVNDSARAMMAELRKFIDDLGASATSTTMQTSAGTSTVYTLTTEGSADNLENGRIVCFIVDEGNGAAPTLNVDSLGAKNIYIADGTALTGGEMVANTIQCLSYDAAANAAAGAWMMRNRFITVEAGGGIENDGSTGALQRSALTGDVTAAAGSNATTIANDAVTFAKMANVSATDRFIGRDTAGSGDAEEITPANAYLMIHGADPNADRISFWDDSGGAAGYLAPDSSLSISGTTFSRAALTGDVTASAGSNATTVATDAVALSTDTTGNYVMDVADGTGIDGTCSSEGCTYTPTFDPTEISSGTWGAGSFTSFTYNASAGSDPVETFGDGTVTWTATTSFGLDNQGALRFYEGDGGGSNYVDVKAPATIASNRTCTLEDDSTPFDSCVTPPSGIPDGDKTDITTSSSGTVWTIDADAVTYSKMQNVTATDRLIGRDSTGAGDPEEIAVSGGLEFTGSLGLQTSAFTGDVTKTAGGTALSIAADAVGAPEIAADAVGASEVAADAIGTSEIATDGVGAAEIAASAVGTSEVADGTITETDLASSVMAKGHQPGEIVTWAGSTCPTYSVEANGQELNRTTYAALFAVTAEIWGDGDNSTTFQVPDLRGWFMRGWDHTAGNDPDSSSRFAEYGGGATGDAVGSYQSDQFQSHSHSYGNGGGTNTVNNGSNANAADTSSGTTGNTGGNETRPQNANVLFCVWTGV